jgi:uncharacterized protein YdaU (DUF1376 family)
MKIHTIQLNIEDYKNGTEFMDAEQSGAYLHLLMACYQSKEACLPDDDVILARIAKVSPYKWKKIKPIILEKFVSFEKNSKKYFKNFRVNLELEKIKNLSEKNRSNICKRWQTEASQESQEDTIVLRSYYDRNTNNKLEDIKEEKNINPYIPLEDSEQKSNAEISGVEKQVSWEVNDIINALDDKSLQLAKINAPGWDVYHLAGVYVDGINNDIIIDGVNKGKRPKPKCIKAAFPEWCKRYTKGLRP